MKALGVTGVVYPTGFAVIHSAVAAAIGLRLRAYDLPNGEKFTFNTQNVIPKLSLGYDPTHLILWIRAVRLELNPARVVEFEYCVELLIE